MASKFSSIRVQINKAINARLKAKLKNVRVENLAEANRAQQSSVLTFFFDSSQADPPIDVNPEEGYTQKLSLFYRCNVRSASLAGDDKNAEIVDRIQSALLGLQVIPQSFDNEGFIYLVSDQAIELENGILYHSVVVGVDVYLLIPPVDSFV